MSDIFTEAQTDMAQKHPTLGHSYEAASRIAERAMQGFEAEHFKPIVEKIVKDVQSQLWDSVEWSLLSDVEMNIQGEIWRTVDQIIRAILGGDQWVLQKYALGPSYDCDKVRAAVAAHVPKELQDSRIADLEAEVKRLNERLETFRNRY